MPEFKFRGDELVNLLVTYYQLGRLEEMRRVSNDEEAVSHPDPMYDQDALKAFMQDVASNLALTPKRDDGTVEVTDDPFTIEVQPHG